MNDIIEDAYPFQRHLGFEVSHWTEHFCRIELPLQPFHMNRHGIPHGGLYATLLDTAMGFAGCWTGDKDAPQLCLTLSLNTNYLGQAKGNQLVAIGRKTGGGYKTFFTEGEIKDDTGVLVATATGVFRYKRS